LREYIDADRIANAICQDTTFHGTYVLVEGNNDYILFRKFLNSNSCEFQVLSGKQFVIDVLTELESRGRTVAIGIVDSDFDVLDKDECKIDNIFYSDNHDLELMIVNSDAFEILIDLYCSKEKLNKFVTENEGKELKSILLDLSAPLGQLKWANKLNNWGLSFKPQDSTGQKLKIEEFLPPGTLKFLGYPAMVKTVFNYSRPKANFTVTEETVLQFLEQLVSKDVDKYHLCNGHDFTYLFALALRKKIASMNSNAISSEQIEQDLILAYESRFFILSKLYAELKTWEIKEQKPILKV